MTLADKLAFFSPGGQKNWLLKAQRMTRSCSICVNDADTLKHVTYLAPFWMIMPRSQCVYKMEHHITVDPVMNNW